MVREEGVGSLARGVGPNVFRAVLMNASQLASCVSPPLPLLLFPLRLSLRTFVRGAQLTPVQVRLLQVGAPQERAFPG